MSEGKKGDIKRRDFLKILGVAGGTAALAGACSEPVEQIIPYVIPPEGIIPGIPNWYASTCRECPAGCGIVVKNREGRAIKIEGNQNNPINLGSSCARGQSALQGLYNPDRVRSPLIRNDAGKLQPAGWDKAQTDLTERINEALGKANSGKAVFLTNQISGSLDKLIKEWVEGIGGEHYVYETFAHEPLKEANKLAFGIDAIPTYKIDKAKYLLSFGADFIETWLSPVEYTKQFSQMHSYKDKEMGKYVHVEPRASLTAASADDWIAVKPGTEAVLALCIANVIVKEGLSSAGGGLGGVLGKYDVERVSEITDVPVEKIKEVAKDFATMGPSLALGGGVSTTTKKATETMVAVNILNYVAGNLGDTIDFGDALTISDANTYEDITGLVDSMTKGEVEILFIYNVNPSFTLPKALKFDEALKNVPTVVSFGSYLDETSSEAHMILPDNTTLESWGDYIPKASVHSLIQPIMKPVFNTKATGDVLLATAKNITGLETTFTQAGFYEYLQDAWKEVWSSNSTGKPFDKFWDESLKQGGFYDEVTPRQASLSGAAGGVDFTEPEFEGDGEYYFMAYPSYRYYDGRGANKPWLQELPEALSTGVWDSWVEMHPETAKKFRVKMGDFVSIESPQGKITTQVYVYEGIRPDTVAVQIGQGHTSYGRYAKDRGVNPIDILPSATDERSGGFAWLTTKVALSRTGKSAQFVQTQYTTTQHDRDIAQAVTLSELKHGIHHEEHHEPDFYPPREYARYRWAMSIDLAKCVGCGACVTSCNAENNVPFVGKALVAKRRDMAWIRIERYFEKSPDGKSQQTRFLPMTCQQCGNAPCEPVCPVFATYHNPEGLNGMVYNRCVGTRYCANNCTYKVRKFNWFDYKLPEPLNWQLNPDVTVRSKGVMEKCTFCVQRIVYAKDQAKDKNRDVLDGEVLTACQQACPADAIVFGNLEDKKSEVYKKSHDERGYRVLEVINTQPAITYLKKVVRDKA